jgi:hypothetical protein
LVAVVPVLRATPALVAVVVLVDTAVLYPENHPVVEHPLSHC